MNIALCKKTGTTIDDTIKSHDGALTIDMSNRLLTKRS